MGNYECSWFAIILELFHVLFFKVFTICNVKRVSIFYVVNLLIFIDHYCYIFKLSSFLFCFMRLNEGELFNFFFTWPSMLRIRSFI